MSDVLQEKLSIQGTDSHVGLIVLNRVEAYNALSPAVIEKIDESIEEYEKDTSVCLIAITGNGVAFSTGGDLKFYREIIDTEDKFDLWVKYAGQVMGKLASSRKPTVALVNGLCIAGGLEILLSCDFAYAVESAKFGDGHANYAVIGGYGSQSRLPKRIGLPRALEMLFTARMIDAEQALEWGLVNKVVPMNRLIDECLTLGSELAGKSAETTARVKNLSYACVELSDEAAIDLERSVTVQHASESEDMRIGLEAYEKKTQPVFRRG
jgi:enoyl-CoA hydratase/carnithine racemase